MSGGAIGKGYVQVYTGNGKGKTTASLGLAVRAAGHGLTTVIIQSMKGWIDYGELAGVRMPAPPVETHRAGRAPAKGRGVNSLATSTLHDRDFAPRT